MSRLVTTHPPSFRWGFLGTARIARRNWEAVRLSGNGVIAAVASRGVEKARAFIAEMQAESPFAEAPAALGSYEELIASPEIDAVYIPLPTGLRKEWVIRAAKAGKHVLCEKTCAIDAGSLRTMLEACRANGVLFMDGVMFMHSARLEKLREAMAGIGPLRRVTSAFCFDGAEEFLSSNIRLNSELEPQGCLGDLGWYNIRLALWAARWELPESVSGRMLEGAARADSPVPVPASFSAELVFAGGFSSSFFCSFLTNFQQWARFDGVKGALTMDDFVLPAEKHGRAGFMDGNTRITVDEAPLRDAGAQATKLFRNFSDHARDPRRHAEWAEMALKTQVVADALMVSAANGGERARARP